MKFLEGNEILEDGESLRVAMPTMDTRQIPPFGGISTNAALVDAYGTSFNVGHRPGYVFAADHGTFTANQLAAQQAWEQRGAWQRDAWRVDPAQPQHELQDTRRPLCPLVKIQPTVRGWYTVSIGHFLGTPVTADFTLRYGRYNNGNPNCTSPTTPLLAERAAKPSAASPTPENGPGQ